MLTFLGSETWCWLLTHMAVPAVIKGYITPNNPTLALSWARCPSLATDFNWSSRSKASSLKFCNVKISQITPRTIQCSCPSCDWLTEWWPHRIHARPQPENLTDFIPCAVSRELGRLWQRGEQILIISPTLQNNVYVDMLTDPWSYCTDIMPLQTGPQMLGPTV